MDNISRKVSRIPPFTYYTLPPMCSNFTADIQQFLCRIWVLFLQSHMQ